MTTQAALRREEKGEAISRLREILPPGTTVYTVLRHVASSGMSRDIDVYVIKDNKPRYLSGLVAKATGMRLSPKNRGLRVSGAGMDMGFHVVYSLSRTLYPDGHFCIGKGDPETGRGRCPSNDHSNDYGALSREYDEAHDQEGRRYADDYEVRSAYCAARADWMATKEDELWSPTRQHRDGGYALEQAWL